VSIDSASRSRYTGEGEYLLGANGASYKVEGGGGDGFRFCGVEMADGEERRKGCSWGFP